MVKVRAFKLVSDDVLEFPVGKCDVVFTELVYVHVGREVRIRNGWIGSCDHVCPY